MTIGPFSVITVGLQVAVRIEPIWILSAVVLFSCLTLLHRALKARQGGK